MNAWGELTVEVCGGCWQGEAPTDYRMCCFAQYRGIVAGSNERWFVFELHEKVATYKINVAFGGIRLGKPL
jgi:hypothetical protein